MKTAAIIVASLVVGGSTLALQPARADGEPPRIDDAHPPRALWYTAIPGRFMVMGTYGLYPVHGLYPIQRNVSGHGFYMRPVRGYRY